MEIIAKTIEKDEEYLRQVSKEVDMKDKNLVKEISSITEYCRSHEILALAAVQIGIPKRIIYIKNTNLDNLLDDSVDENRVLINPKVISKKGKTKFWEACESCINITGLVTRPYEIVVEYQDLNNDIHREKFQGFESTVLSHELDHLDGILHMDIAEKIVDLPREERAKLREKEPYEIISKTDKYKILKK